jgi:hypothetical protein
MAGDDAWGLFGDDDDDHGAAAVASGGGVLPPRCDPRASKHPFFESARFAWCPLAGAAAPAAGAAGPGAAAGAAAGEEMLELPR